MGHTQVYYSDALLVQHRAEPGRRETGAVDRRGARGRGALRVWNGGDGEWKGSTDVEVASASG